MKVRKRDVLQRVHEILRRRWGELGLISGQGIATGERVEFLAEGKRVRCTIKTSSGGRVSFWRRDGKWSGLHDSDFVVIVAPTAFDADLVVSMFDHHTVKQAFDANQAAQEKAGMGDVPNWIAPFHEEGRGVRGIGDGFDKKALWSEPLRPTNRPKSLTIQEAKQQLSESLGVPVEAIEIVISA